MNQFQYGGWNPRGTANAEYGKFVYKNEGRSGWSPSMENMNMMTFGGHQHYPGCQHYNTNNGQQQQEQLQWQWGNQQHHVHQPTCPNYTAAEDNNGGDQAEQIQVQAVTPGPVPASAVPSSVSVVDAVKSCEDDVEVTPTDADAGGGDATTAAAMAPEDAMSAPTPAKDSSSKVSITSSTKWRGLPRSTVKYGRVPGSSLLRRQSSTSLLASPSPSSMQVQMQNWQQQKMPMNNNTNMCPQAPQQQMMMMNESGDTTPMMAMPMNQKAKTRMMMAPPKVNLCGRCPKCKTYTNSPYNFAPPPTVASFAPGGGKVAAASSASSLTTTVGRIHQLGRQDAKNFRAVAFKKY